VADRLARLLPPDEDLGGRSRRVFVTDQIPRITLLTSEGRLIGRCRGAVNGAHGLCGDSRGNLYLAELPPQDITKLERLD